MKQLAIPLSNQPKNFWPGTRKTIAKWLVISSKLDAELTQQREPQHLDALNLLGFVPHPSLQSGSNREEIVIHELSGDILFSGAKAIAQGVAPNDDFHHGLALQLRERMPVMYKDFRHFCQTKHPKSGGVWTWMSSDGRYIVNLFTQDAAYDHGSKPGHAKLTHVNHSLHALRDFVQKEKAGSVALPRLACGMTGLDWDEVKPLIEKQLGDLGIPVYIYTTYQKGVKANEPK